MTPIEWDNLPRLLHDLCDGRPNIREVLYGWDGAPHRLWLCRSCYLDEVLPPAARIDVTALAAMRRGAR